MTGGASGIGRGIVEYFAERGTAVSIADRDEARGRELATALHGRGKNVEFIPTDVRDEQSVAAMTRRTIARWGRIDCLCNNAGIELYKVAEDYTLEDWGAIIDTNLRGPFLCARSALPFLKKAEGSIVNIASIQAISCEQRISIYAASKAGLLGLTRGLAVDYARDGVRVNAVSPGPIHSRMMEEYLAAQHDPEAVIGRMREAVPLGRIGEPIDVAALAYFLCSPESGFITGANYVVDGGCVSKLSL